MFKIVICRTNQYIFRKSFISLESNENNWLKPLRLNVWIFHFSFNPKLLRKENLLLGQDDFHRSVLSNIGVNEREALKT